MEISLTQGSVVPFSRALTSREEEDFKKVTGEAMEALDVKDGIRMFKVFQTALPSNKNENLGIGRVNSDKAIEYLKFNALYTGSNAVKIYPVGQIPSTLRFKNYYCPYERSASVIGEDNINFFKLTKPEYGSLLTKKDILPYTVSDNKSYADYENELDGKRGIDLKLLQKAYNNMQKTDTKAQNRIKSEFETYKQSIKSDTIDRLAIAPFVRDKDPDLFMGFENSPEKQQRFEEYKLKYEKETDIFKFGKFLALKNLKEAKSEINKNKMELYGDCPIGFSQDEVFCFPEAFYPKEITPGWGFRAIKYDEIPKKGTMANRLFTEKLKWHLENFDGIRFDVGWQYMKPNLKREDNGEITNFSVEAGEDIVEYIEKTAKEIKGEDFDTKKLMYELDAGPEDFQMFDWDNSVPEVKEVVKGRTAILTDVYEHSDGLGWGNPNFYKKAGLEDYIIGTSNHDSIPLKALSEGSDKYFKQHGINVKDIKKGNINALSKSLKLKKKFLEDPQNFVKAKFAELFQAKNHFVFFNDVTGNKTRIDWHNPEPYNYRYRINGDYEKEYHKALQEHKGFNLAESLRIAMKAQNIDKTNPELYEKIKYYSDILYSKGAKTKEAENYFNFDRLIK